MSSVFGDIYTKDELEKMSDDKEVIFRDIYRSKILPINGLRKFLDSLKKNNILLSIGSNAIRKNVDKIGKYSEYRTHTPKGTGF